MPVPADNTAPHDQSATGESAPLPWEVTPSELADHFDKGDDVVLIDCRTAEERDVARIDPLEGAGGVSLFLPMDEFATHLPTVTAAAGAARRAPVIVYCHSGRRSMVMARALRDSGIERAQSMAGGIDRWSVEIDASVPRY